MKKIIGDPKVQAVLNTGLADGDPNDDKLPYTRANISVGDLKPTQKEIGFELLLNENRLIKKDGEHISLIGVENWGKGGFKKVGDLITKIIEGLSNMINKR